MHIPPPPPPVSLAPILESEDSDDDPMDTEDEYEGLPELTLDLEGELANPALKAKSR